MTIPILTCNAVGSMWYSLRVYVCNAQHAPCEHSFVGYYIANGANDLNTTYLHGKQMQPDIELFDQRDF